MSWSDSTLVPPVTAERSPPDSRMTGADSPVMADSSTEATPSMTSPSPGMMSPGRAEHEVADPRASWTERPEHSGYPRRLAELLGLRFPAGLAQLVGLGLAPPFGHRLGEVREQHGEPEPQRQLEDEPEVRRAPDQLPDQHEGGEHAADQDHEHDRVPDHVTRRQFDERRP